MSDASILCAQSVLLGMDNPSETGWRWLSEALSDFISLIRRVFTLIWTETLVPQTDQAFSALRLDIKKNLVYYWTSMLKHDASNTKVMGLIFQEHSDQICPTLNALWVSLNKIRVLQWLTLWYASTVSEKHYDRRQQKQNWYYALLAHVGVSFLIFSGPLNLPLSK